MNSIDLTAEVCPMTFVKVKVALHEMPEGGVLEVLLRGEEAVRNVPRAVAEDGHKVLSIEPAGDGLHKVVIEKSYPPIIS